MFFAKTDSEIMGNITFSVKYVTSDSVTNKLNDSMENLSGASKAKQRVGKVADAGELHCFIKEAKNLPLLKGQNRCFPYCKCYLLPDPNKRTKQKSFIAKKTRSPSWEHIIVYPGVVETELGDMCLEVTIWNKRLLWRNEFLGGCRLNLGTGKYKGNKVKWMDAVNDERNVWKAIINNPNEWIEAMLPLRLMMDTNSVNQQSGFKRAFYNSNWLKVLRKRQEEEESYDSTLSGVTIDCLEFDETNLRPHISRSGCQGPENYKSKKHNTETFVKVDEVTSNGLEGGRMNKENFVQKLSTCVALGNNGPIPKIRENNLSNQIEPNLETPETMTEKEINNKYALQTEILNTLNNEHFVAGNASEHNIKVSGTKKPTVFLPSKLQAKPSETEITISKHVSNEEVFQVDQSEIKVNQVCSRYLPQSTVKCSKEFYEVKKNHKDTDIETEDEDKMIPCMSEDGAHNVSCSNGKPLPKCNSFALQYKPKNNSIDSYICKIQPKKGFNDKNKCKDKRLATTKVLTLRRISQDKMVDIITPLFASSSVDNFDEISTSARSTSLDFLEASEWDQSTFFGRIMSFFASVLSGLSEIQRFQIIQDLLDLIRTSFAKNDEEEASSSDVQMISAPDVQEIKASKNSAEVENSSDQSTDESYKSHLASAPILEVANTSDRGLQTCSIGLQADVNIQIQSQATHSGGDVEFPIAETTGGPSGNTLNPEPPSIGRSVSPRRARTPQRSVVQPKDEDSPETSPVSRHEEEQNISSNKSIFSSRCSNASNIRCLNCSQPSEVFPIKSPATLLQKDITRNERLSNLRVVENTSQSLNEFSNKRHKEKAASFFDSKECSSYDKNYPSSNIENNSSSILSSFGTSIHDKSNIRIRCSFCRKRAHKRWKNAMILILSQIEADNRNK